MESKCIGENSEFASYHPLVNLLYFVFVIGITMFSLSPYFLAVTLLFSWLYSILLKGKKGIKMNLAMGISILVIMTVVNLFFNNNGETVLLYINTNRITAESIGYGIAGGIMLLSVVVWFSCFNVIMSSDKLIYLFGKAAPVLGLTLSMIFRFIPLLQSRFAEISIGQKCMGRGHDQGSLIKRARQFTKEISILIAWSLEASIERDVYKRQAHRKAMLRNLVTDLFREGRISTTDCRAKEARREAEKMITIAKRGDLHARRQVLAYVYDESVVTKLFEEIAPKYADRNGGYTRILKLGPRRGDNAEVVFLELV